MVFHASYDHLRQAAFTVINGLHVLFGLFVDRLLPALPALPSRFPSLEPIAFPVSRIAWGLQDEELKRFPLAPGLLGQLSGGCLCVQAKTLRNGTLSQSKQTQKKD